MGWADGVQKHISTTLFGQMLLQTSESAKIRKCCLRAQKEGKLAQWTAVLGYIDEEFQWSTAGEGVIRHRQYRRVQKAPSTPMEDHITTHEDAYGKMKELCFPITSAAVVE